MFHFPGNITHSRFVKDLEKAKLELADRPDSSDQNKIQTHTVSGRSKDQRQWHSVYYFLLVGRWGHSSQCLHILHYITYPSLLHITYPSLVLMSTRSISGGESRPFNFLLFICEILRKALDFFSNQIFKHWSAEIFNRLLYGFTFC